MPLFLGVYMNNNVFKNLSYGVYIVSCKNGDKYTGCTVNSIMQITSSPAYIALSINKENFTNICIDNNKLFAVSILSEKSNPLSIGTFGFRSGRDFEKFSVIEHVFNNDLPIVKDACAYLICKVIDKIDAQTHTLFIAEVLDGNILNEEIPMTYSYYHNVIKGKSPKTAPTYVEP